jgi:hypothetical protein
MRIMRKYYIIVICIILQSCSGPFSNYPLCNPDDAYLDKDIFGIWYAEESTFNYYMIVGIDTASNLVANLFTQDQDGRITESYRINFFLSDLESGNYINIFDSENDQYFIMKYKITSNDTLIIWFFDEDKIKTDILSGDLKGVYKKDSLNIFNRYAISEILSIEAPTDELIRYLNSYNPDTLFSDKREYFRLR